MSYSGTSISDRLNGVIESLDKKTETKVKAEYGEDIASKVEHISKQIENLPEGGSGSGSESGDDRLSILVTAKMFAGDMTYGIAPDYNTIIDYLNTHSNSSQGKFPAIDVFIDNGTLRPIPMAQVCKSYDEDSGGQKITIDAVTGIDIVFDENRNFIKYAHQVLGISLKSDNSIIVAGDTYVILK